MSSITLSLIKRTSEKLLIGESIPAIKFDKSVNIKHSQVTLSLLGKYPASLETTEEIAKLNSALRFISPDVGRGHGSFYDRNNIPEHDYWLAAVWSIASLGWASGESIARNWSQQSQRYTHDGFNQAWNGYQSNHNNAIGIGSLYKKAKDLGWQPPVITPSPSTQTNNINNTPRFNLLGLDQLSQLPSSEWLIKGLLPDRGLASIYGPSGSGKTFLALDLLMAIAVKPDWFGFKVKNAPVIYIGLEGKTGINRRIEAWVTKNKIQKL
jgi:hypothetical protein